MLSGVVRKVPMQKGMILMPIMLGVAGITSIAMLIYLVYVLFKGDDMQ